MIINHQIIKSGDVSRLEPDVTVYPTPAAHLQDEFEIIEIAIEALVAQREKNGQFYKEISSPFSSDKRFSSRKNHSLKTTDSYRHLLQEKRHIIDTRLEAAKTHGPILPWHCLVERFSLDSLERLVLLLCLASWFDNRYAGLFGRLLDEDAKSFPSMELARLIAQIAGDAIVATTDLNFTKNRTIFEWNIIEHVYDNTEAPSSPLKVNGRIAAYVNGSVSVDPLLDGIAQIRYDLSSLSELFFNDTESNTLQAIAASLGRLAEGKGVARKEWWYLHGSQSSGRKSAARAVCRELGLPVLQVDIAALMCADHDTRAIIKSIAREAVLNPCGICLNDFDRLFGDDEKVLTLRRWLINELLKVTSPVFCIGKLLLSSISWEKDFSLIPIELTHPLPELRRKIWEMAIAPFAREITSQEIARIAERFRFTAGEIVTIAHSVTAALPTETSEEQSLAEQLTKCCAAGITARLPQFATRVPPSPFTWKDLILPEANFELLKDICARAMNQRKIFYEWGFGSKAPTGQGINALFTGISGTGKTMAAGIIARELGLDMFRIDLSLIISKYIGETEKNLAAVFREAESSRAILFFDEADALFGKRSSIKDAHDRYANIEVAYLLQKMEEYEGITILATNFRQNIDEAFTRRMHFIVEFPQPDRPQRERLWQTVFPAQAPSRDIDFAFLARQFTITGANIKNIAVNAAFQAAKKDEPIAMDHILHAVRREYKKTGSFIAEDALVYTAEERSHA